MNKVYAVKIVLYYAVMGETYCECCGPETEYESQGYFIDSLHLSKEDAVKKSKEIDIETELPEIEYDFAQISVVEMEVNQ